MMMAMNTSQGTLTPGGDGPASAVAIVMALIAGVLAMIYALVERKANEQWATQSQQEKTNAPAEKRNA